MPSKYFRRMFIKGYYYHIYNRGANKEIVFKDESDYFTFTQILAYYLTFPLGKPFSLNLIDKNNIPNINNGTISTIELCVYCLMPNHFHLLIKQAQEPTKDNSISNLMRRVIITYAMYFQHRYDHSGTVFQGKFKNVLVSSDVQLLQLSKYIHLNPIKTLTLGSEPNIKYSSYKFYTGAEVSPNWLNIKDILTFFSKPNIFSSYKKFVEETPIEVERIQKITLE